MLFGSIQDNTDSIALSLTDDKDLYIVYDRDSHKFNVIRIPSGSVVPGDFEYIALWRVVETDIMYSDKFGTVLYI